MGLKDLFKRQAEQKQANGQTLTTPPNASWQEKQAADAARQQAQQQANQNKR